MNKYLILQEREDRWKLLERTHWLLAACKYIFFGFTSLCFAAFITSLMFDSKPSYFLITVDCFLLAVFWIGGFWWRINAMNLHQLIIYEEVSSFSDLDKLLEVKVRLEERDEFKPKLFKS
jgi:hypothetical protein